MTWRELQTLQKKYATTNILGSFNRRRRILGTGHHATAKAGTVDEKSFNRFVKKLQPWKSFNGREKKAAADGMAVRRPTATDGEDGDRRRAGDASRQASERPWRVSRMNSWMRFILAKKTMQKADLTVGKKIN